jgi:hypothetical protein
MACQAESVIKNIIKEITIEASRKGQDVSETLAAFLVKATVLNPDQEFSSDRPLTKEDVHRLIAVCVDKLMETSSPGLDLVKMQVHFDMNYTKRNDFLEEHRQLLEGRLQPITREITDTRARSKDELEGLYRKIVSYILLRSGLGSATDIIVVRETSAALQSVFPPSELGGFMALTKQEKNHQMVELVHIVTGIRLFNKECGKGGAGIDDLPRILKEAIQTTSQHLETEMRKALDNSFSLTGSD